MDTQRILETLDNKIRSAQEDVTLFTVARDIILGTFQSQATALKNQYESKIVELEAHKSDLLRVVNEKEALIESLKVDLPVAVDVIEPVLETPTEIIN